MKDLLQTEWLKIRKYAAFWWMLGIVTLTYPSINAFFHFIFQKLTKGGSADAKQAMQTALMTQLIGNPFAFPETWHTIGYFSSWFLIVPAMLVIMLISNEYNYKTHRQNIIDGWTRSQFITAKLLGVFIISAVVTVAFVVIATIFGIYYSSEFQITRWAEQIQYIPLFLLQTFAQLTLAFLCGFLMKRSFIALGVFVFYYLIVENILASIIKFKFDLPKLASFLPIEISDKLIPSAAFIGKIDMEAYEQNLSEINMHIFYTLALTAGIWLLCYKLNEKRDL